MNQSLKLKDKIVLITGGGGVLGSIMAQALAENGAIVGVMGRTLTTLTAVVDTIKQAGGQAFAIQANVLGQKELEISNLLRTVYLILSIPCWGYSAGINTGTKVQIVLLYLRWSDICWLMLHLYWYIYW